MIVSDGIRGARNDSCYVGAGLQNHSDREKLMDVVDRTQRRAELDVRRLDLECRFMHKLWLREFVPSARH